MVEPADSTRLTRYEARNITFNLSNQLKKELEQSKTLIGNELTKRGGYGLPEEVRKCSFKDGYIVVEMADGTTRKIKPDAGHPQLENFDGRNQNDGIRFHNFGRDWGFEQNIDTSNDNAFDVTNEVDHTNDKNFIPMNSDLGKQIGRTIKDYRSDIDKYKPVYGKPDSLGRREIIGYTQTNLWDLFK